MVVSGSSARLLSREVHTSLRGRGFETILWPFSVREFLRHRNEEPTKPVARLSAAKRSLVEKRLLRWIARMCLRNPAGLLSAHALYRYLRSQGHAVSKDTVHALETAVLNALARQGAEVGYVKTEDGFEVDFLAPIPGEPERLIQVCADPTPPEVLERERRALNSAARTHPRAQRILIVLTQEQAARLSGEGVRVYPAYEWLLEEDR